VDAPELAGKGGTASLALFGADGQPFRSVSRGVVQQQWPVINGSAAVDGLPAGSWRAVVTGANGALWQATTVLGEGEEGWCGEPHPHGFASASMRWAIAGSLFSPGASEEVKRMRPEAGSETKTT